MSAPVSAFCLDVDGVMTDGTFLYSKHGKELKRFGPDDSEALRLISRHLEVFFVSADYRGMKISRRRLQKDLGFSVDLVPAADRVEWLASRNDLQTLAYMGDSFTDAQVLREVRIGIAPANASPKAKAHADIVTEASGGRGAVAEACFILASQLGLGISEFG